MTSPSDEPTAHVEPSTPESPAGEPAAPAVAAQPGYAGYPYPDPAFAPVARAPRSPWVNPAKRVPAAIIAGATGLVLLGGGMAVGYAIGNHSDRDGRFEHVRMVPFDRNDLRPGLPFRPGKGDRPNRQFPGGPMHPNLPSPSASPSPSGSGSATS